MKTNRFLRAILIGAGAGVAAALLFAGLRTGSTLAMSLFFGSSLPVAIAWLGFGAAAGLAAVVGGAAVVAFAVSMLHAGVFLALIALPVSWVAFHFIAPGGPDEHRRWGDLSALLTQAALAIAIGVVANGILIGYDPEDMLARSREQIASLQATQPQLVQGFSTADLEAIWRAGVNLTPYVFSVILLVSMVISLWGAGRIVLFSRLAERTWAPFHTVRAQSWLAIGFAISFAAASILPQPGTAVAFTFLGAFGAALVLAGLAAIHGLTLGRPGRPIILFATYLMVMFPLPILLLGIADSFFNFRARKLASGSSN